MSEINWNKKQLEAIEKDGTGIVVSAAAGSGKTTVMIERLSRLLLDENNKIPAQNLLAVTFTTKAAASMRVKLNSAVDKEINKCFSSAEMRQSEKSKWLLEQKSNLQFAKVSTINSFCLEFVKDNLAYFEFQSGLKILDEATELMIYQKAYTAALEELCAKDMQSYRELTNTFSMLEKTARQLYKFIRTIPFREQWLEQAAKCYTDPECIEEELNEYYTSFTDAFSYARQRLNALLVLMQKLSVYSQIPRFKESLATVCTQFDAKLTSLEKSFDAMDTDAYFEALSQSIKVLSFKTNKEINSMEIGERSQLIDMCREAVDTYKAINSKLADLKTTGLLTKDRAKANLKATANAFEKLYSVVKRTQELAHEEKLERNAVDFSDVEMMTKDLLVEMKDGEFVRTPLCEDIRKSGVYKLITIDEFQDVNNLQELIFRALSDSDSLDHMGANAFVVGDIKQAIYRFRQTNPELFSKTVADANKGFDDLCSIDLQENYRSRNGIIDFANFVFSGIMYESIGGVDYDEKQRLKFGAKYYPEDEKSENCVELMLVDRHDDYDLTEQDEEMVVVAQRIKKLIAHSDENKVYDSKLKAMRPCKQKDICVLLPTNDGVSKMVKALKSVGLSAFSQESVGYLKASEITLALNILRVIDNPHNNIAMVSMLMSPVFAFSANDMMKIQEKRKSKDSDFLKSVYNVVSFAHFTHIDLNTPDFEYDRVFEDDDELREKCSGVYQALESFKNMAMSTNLERLIRYIFDTTELLSLTSIYLDSSKKRANLLLFLQYAKEYENSGNEGVSGFLHYIDSVYDNDSAFKQAGITTSSGDCVNVMTFHGSKGLEFPYVFLCDLARKNNNFGGDGIYLHYKVTQDDNDKNVFSFDTQDIKHHMVKENIVHRKYKKLNVLEEKSEKLRLLYVACTRAQEKLFISISPDVSGKTKVSTGKLNLENALVKADRCTCREELEEHIASCSNMLEWLMCALSFARLGKDFSDWLRDDSDEKKAKTLVDKETLDDILCAPTKPLINTEIVRLVDEPVSAETETKAAPKVFDPELVSKLAEIYKKESQRQTEVLENAMKPAKLTVTEIVRDEKEKAEAQQKSDEKSDSAVFDPEFFPSLPKLDEKKSKLTPAEKGTFTHKFMETADYSLAEISVKSELERLVSQGYFTPKEASGVYVDRLKEFFASDFYSRMKNAETIMREKKFMVAMKDICVNDEHKKLMGDDGMIQGIADCVFKESDGFVIVDYKTDRFKTPDDMDKYGTQLEFYKAALEIVLGEENADGTIFKAKIKSCYIYSFMLGLGKEFVF